jgi:hypothetical protein
MHSHFRVSWGYDTVMIKGRKTFGRGGRSQYTFHRKPKGSLLLPSIQHWIVSFLAH